MIRFYEYHLRGNSETNEGPMAPVRALRQAQCWLRNVTSEELSQLFAYYRDTLSDRDRIPFALAQQKFREYSLRSGYAPTERPFAHPYHWAAFEYYGV